MKFSRFETLYFLILPNKPLMFQICKKSHHNNIIKLKTITKPLMMVDLDGNKSISGESPPKMRIIHHRYRFM